jgi:hypothetical protein
MGDATAASTITRALHERWAEGYARASRVQDRGRVRGLYLQARDRGAGAGEGP